VEIWLRSNLTNMVYRGNIDKEKLSSLRPTHLSSYLVRNNSHARDYASSDQVYLMLGTNPQVKNELKDFLAEGWDPITNSINANANLDVDSLGLLQITKFYKPGFSDSKSTLNQIKPLLIDQAKLYTEDIRRILVYKRLIPRNVIIDYIKTITSFHLSIYYKKLVYSLPLMVKHGSVNIDFDWNIVIDATDDFESKVSRIASADTEKFTNSISDYVKATYQINANTNIAFKENMEAFKQKLRQIGFYNDMSDAYILQKVRPRYEITHD